MSGITSFRNVISRGGARGNQFRVFLQFPIALGIVNAANAARDAQFLCEGASLPGQNLGIAMLNYRGRQVKLAGERIFDNWDITVINEENFGLHNAFEQWANAINNLNDNSGVLNSLDYMVNLNVQQLDRNDNVLKEYTFRDAWPVSISPIQLNFGDNDNIERFTVSFAIDSFDSSATIAVNNSATTSTNAVANALVSAFTR